MQYFARKLIAWQLEHGRHDLPWQLIRTPFSVWVSEVMLQQTQVKTVLPYFNRFLSNFSDVKALAEAPEDQVFALWSGLGYYSRARNLHKAARIMMSKYNGTVPHDYEDLISLPGIGRSTAGAILALAYRKPYPILDGNAKRVFSRFFNVAGASDSSYVVNEMWGVAEKNVPHRKADVYTQGLMDLGASICSRKDPNCGSCPLQPRCFAHKHKKILELPGPRKKKNLKKQNIYMIACLHKRKVLLERAPSNGLCPGLWNLIGTQEFDEQDTVKLAKKYDFVVQNKTILKKFRHRLTHIDYTITPIIFEVTRKMEELTVDQEKWISLDDTAIAVSVPVRKVLDVLRQAKSL